MGEEIYMEKTIKKSYRILVLFLLMSVSVFAVNYERTIVEQIDTTNYNEIKINLITITNQEVESLNLFKMKEKRAGSLEKNYNGDDVPNMTKTKINSEGLINGQEWKIEGNKILMNGEKITIDGKEIFISGNKVFRKSNNRNKNIEQHLYRWTGTYKTKFQQEAGKERRVSFDAMRTLKNKNRSEYTVRGLLGSYIEPDGQSVGVPSSQWIYSQIIKENLLKSDKDSKRYNIDFYKRLETIKTIDKDDNLDELLKLDVVGVDGSFVKEEKERYRYEGEPKSIVEFKITSNIGKPQSANFRLTYVDESGDVTIHKRLINENYMIPVPVTDFKVQDLEQSKNTFTYQDRYELENLKSYKYQEVVFRLYTGSKHDEVRPIKRIEEIKNLVNFNNNDYVDFVFENNNSTQELEKNGIKGRFIEGKFELMGLEDNKSYNLDFYTLRYRNNNKTRNYVAVTYEGSLDFKGKNISSTEDTIWLEDIDISDYKKIKLNMTSITTQDVKTVEVLKLIEIRNLIKEEGYDTIETIKQNLNNIWINGKEYLVVDNKIVLDDGTEKYVYNWSGTYNTKFILKEGKVRNLDIGTRRALVKKEDTDTEYADQWLKGKYIEPTKVEEDKTPSHQWVMFEFDPTREFKEQDYRIEDRVLSPERKGYRQLKTLDYVSTMDNVLYGKSGYILENEFDYSNGVWKYPKTMSSKGLIIEKTVTESKGALKGNDVEDLLFYTDNIGEGIQKLEGSGDKVTFRWNEGPLNTNGEILSYDKVIFRITKNSTDYSWNPYTNDNPINYLDDKSDGDARLENFLFGSGNYVDLVFDASTSKTMTFNNAIISYEQTNKELRIVGLPVDDYIIQFYSVKRGHDGTYKVITREKQNEKQNKFHIDISDFSSLDFEKEKNIHKIDFITTGTSSGAIQVNVNFITKMEREIDLTIDNLKSGDFNIEETIKETKIKEGIGKVGIVSLQESDMKKFLFPLDVVFVIDNSSSMQEEIDNVKNGLSAFGQELFDRGFDVKYNLITFGPQQRGGTIGNWANNINEYKDYDGSYYYMAIYKSRWFNGAVLGKPSSPKNDLEELTDAFSKIRAGGGYPYNQENSAWGIHYAIEKLRENGRYLSYSGEIVEDSSEGYMPSEKMIIFLTDENMDTENIASLGYNSSNVLEKLSTELTGEKFNGMPDNIDLNGIFHVEKLGNIVEETVNRGVNYYEKVRIKPYLYYRGSVLEYKYTNGMTKERVSYSKKEWLKKRWMMKGDWDKHKNDPNYKKEKEEYGWVLYSKLEWREQGDISMEEWENGGYATNLDYRVDKTWNENKWIEYDDNEVPVLGMRPSDFYETYHTDFKYHNSANNFFMYEMKADGSGVKPALDRAIDNLGIMQRWDLSYLTPFNEYDGTTRVVDFELVNLIGRDKKMLKRKITNLNKEEDKQYTVKEEKLALEFLDPSVNNLKLSIIDGRGSITFRGKARYNEFDEKNKPIVVESMINEYKLDVLDSNNKLLFNRNTDNITMSLSDEGWYEFKVELTSDEMQKLIDSETVKSTEKINLEARIVTELFNKTGDLKNVEVDLETPIITEIKLTNNTLLKFLETMVDLEGKKSVNDPKKHSGYEIIKDSGIDSDSMLNDIRTTGKTGDEIKLETVVEGKNIDEFDVYSGLNVEGWTGKIVREISGEGDEIKKFKVTWTNKVGTGDKITLVNNVKNSYGLSKNENINVLKIDNTSIEVDPKIGEIGGPYYINSDRKININPVGDKNMAGIALFKYDKEAADEKNKGVYWGNPNYHNIGSNEKALYVGGVMGNIISMNVDTDNHKTDGQFIGSIYGVNKAGKIDKITDYLNSNFDNLLSANKKNLNSGNIKIIVDTIKPRILGKDDKNNYVLPLDKTEDGYKNLKVGFKVEDYNMNYEKLTIKPTPTSSTKGGYFLEFTGTEISSTYDKESKIITYEIKVKDGVENSINIIAEDKAKNQTVKTIEIKKPKEITINIYEKTYKDWYNTTDGETGKETTTSDGYIFTKGGAHSGIGDPAIYVNIVDSSKADIKFLKIETNGGASKTVEVLPQNIKDGKNIEVKDNFKLNAANIVKITPISATGIEGEPKELKFIVDTKINTSYLDNEIIGSLTGKNAVIDLSKIKELSGVDGYEYTFTVEGKKIQKSSKRGLTSNSFTTPKEGSISGTIEIDTSGFIGGSKGELSFTIYDKLGNKKNFKKTYFIPTKPNGIIATVSGEVRQRRSKVKILAEGSGDKFGVESSVDESSEDKD